ncbi:MAG: Dabb family protein [Firmicutes bacterium]|nr:Dabb family protein [Bacillota bacterium]
MIRHIVMWKMAERDEAKMLEIKKSLEALKDELDVIVSIEVGINAGIEDGMDFALVADFKSRDDLASYAEAPAHKAVAAALIKPNVVERRCVDYEF